MKLQVLLFLPLAPLYLPRGIALAFGDYVTNPSPMQWALGFGLYTVCAVCGLVTKWRVFHLAFIALLLLNIEGCVVAEYGVAKLQWKRDAKQASHAACAACPRCGKVKGESR